MKRIFFTMFVLCSIFLLASISVSAEENTLIFDLDIADAVNESDLSQVKDKSGANLCSAVTATGAYTKTETIEGNDKQIQYLQFSDGNRTNTAANVNVTMKTDLVNLANEKELTFELWVRGTGLGSTENSPWDKMFSYGDYTRHQEAFALQVTPTSGQTGNKSLRMYFDRQHKDTQPNDPNASSSSINNYDEMWMHYVVTRKWEANANETQYGSGKWKTTMYVDGSPLIEEISIDILDYRTEYSDDFDDLIIGNTAGTAYQTNAFAGDVAEFRVYKGVLSSKEIFNKYIETREPYKSLAKVENGASVMGSIIDEDETFEITFNQSINVETLRDESISIKDGNGRKVPIEFVSYADEKATFKIYECFDPGAQYTLYMPNVKTTDGEIIGSREIQFIAKESDIHVDIPTKSVVDGVATVTIPVNVSTSVKLTAGLIIYDSLDRVINFRKSLPTTISVSDNLTVSTAGVTLPDGYKLKAIVYDDELNPVTGMIDVQ